MFHAWASAIGLSHEAFLPNHHLPFIALSVAERVFDELRSQGRLVHRSFLLITLYYCLASAADSAEPNQYQREVPLCPTDRVCTIRYTYQKDTEIKYSYEIIVVPGLSQVGDMIANIVVADKYVSVVLRPVKIAGSEGEGLPATYEVVGSCETNKETEEMESNTELIDVPCVVALV